MIFETIITSTNADGNPHIAPFGVRERNGMVLIAPFRPSASLDNLMRSRCAVVNMTDDVRIFAGSLTGRRDWQVRRADRVDGWVLEDALAHRELELVEIEDHEVRPELLFRTIHEQMHAPYRGFNRAQAAVIEASVLVSRLRMLSPEKIEAELKYLSIAMEKTAGEREWQAWEWLMEAIENFRAEQSGRNQA